MNEVVRNCACGHLVGSRGDSHGNALAESVIGRYKAELVHHRGPWRGLDDLEYATLEWVDWWNHCRLLEPIGDVPSAEKEADYYRHNSPARPDPTNRASSGLGAVQSLFKTIVDTVTPDHPWPEPPAE